MMHDASLAMRGEYRYKRPPRGKEYFGHCGRYLEEQDRRFREPGVLGPVSSQRFTHPVARRGITVGGQRGGIAGPRLQPVGQLPLTVGLDARAPESSRVEYLLQVCRPTLSMLR